MLRWFEKTAKVALFKRALAAKGAADFYPSRFLKEVVEISLSKAEKEVSVSYQMGMDSDLDAIWQSHAELDSTVLSVNAICSLSGDELQFETLRKSLVPSSDLVVAAMELSPLLNAYGLPNHMKLVSRAFSHLGT